MIERIRRISLADLIQKGLELLIAILIAYLFFFAFLLSLFFLKLGLLVP
jgi:hypothetical protein